MEVVMPLLSMEAFVAWTDAQTHVGWTLVWSITDIVVLRCQRPWMKLRAASTDVAHAATACNQRDRRAVQTPMCTLDNFVTYVTQFLDTFKFMLTPHHYFSRRDKYYLVASFVWKCWYQHFQVLHVWKCLHFR